MKLLLFLLALFALLQVSLAQFGAYKNMNEEDKLHREPPIRKTSNARQTYDPIHEAWVKTRLDQFDPQNNETFYMRYLMNKEYLQEGSPIFIFVGGEWTISPGTLQWGHLFDMAKNLSGLLIYTEHRYYGFSIPSSDLELKNLKWLNIDQALADLAHFIVQIKGEIRQVQNSKVILVGCSYSGTMVTWFMQKYPHLASGAWSLSAPLLGKVDFVEYKEVVSEAIKNIGGEECSERIKSAFFQMELLWGRGHHREFERIFRLCAPFDASNWLDVWNLFGDMAGPWSGIAQYASRAGQQIENACASFLDTDVGSDMESYAAWVFNRWGFSSTDCYDNRWSYVLYWFNNTSLDSWVARSEWRQWLYQTCAEYGWYQSSGSDNILFGSMFPVNVSLQYCTDLYENFFTPDVVQRNVDRTNVIYGALEPNVRRVYSTHGQYDPWSPMGVSADINNESPTVILPGESHCSDLSSISSRDSPEMVASKTRIFELIKEWLGISSA